MISDANKGISSITYNHLNLPVQVSFNSGGVINYVYDAAGTKLKKTTSTGTATEYAGNYVYSGNLSSTTLQFFNHPEGYVNVENNNYRYVYQYKDHLGNVRLTYADSDGNGSIDASTEIISEKNYYPFGLEHKGYNTVVTSINPAQKSKYNGVELEEALDLDFYEMDFRSYDASLGRFMTIDPLAELVEQLDKSPYTFAWNNPIFYNDPLGLCPDCPDNAEQGDTYTIDNGSVYVFNNGEWERQTVYELDKVVVTPDASAEGETSTAKYPPVYVPVSPKPVTTPTPTPPTAVPYNPGVVGLALILATFYTPDTSPYSPSNIAETLNPESARGLKRNETAVMRVQVQQGTANMASTTATNTAQQGVTTLQADVALVATRELARQQLKKVLSSVQAQRAFAKMAKKIQNAPGNGGIIAGTRTTLQETFIYNN